MPRVREVPPRPPGLLWLLELGARARYGRPFKQLRLIAHNRGFLLPYAGMSVLASGRTRLDPRVRALALRLVAELNDCAWCQDYALAQGRAHGVSDEQLLSVAAYAREARFTPRERAALTYAEYVTMPGARVPEDVHAELRAHFSDREIVELTVAVAAENFFNRVNSALGVEAQGFAR